jgi:hypothetical protein
VEALPHPDALPSHEPPPARASGSAAHPARQHLPRDTGSQHEEDAGENRAIGNRRPTVAVATLGPPLGDPRLQPRPDRVIDEGLRLADRTKRRVLVQGAYREF